MPINGFSHVAIGVSDMERALAFYCNILGLEVAVDHDENIQEGNLPPFKRRAAYLRWVGDRSGTYVVLDTQRRTQPLSPLGFNDTGLHHFGFWVDDLDAIYQRVVAAGCPIVLKPTDFTADNPLNPTGVPSRSTFFRDPDGNIIQLDQLMPGRRSS